MIILQNSDSPPSIMHFCETLIVPKLFSKISNQSMKQMFTVQARNSVSPKKNSWNRFLHARRKEFELIWRKIEFQRWNVVVCSKCIYIQLVSLLLLVLLLWVCTQEKASLFAIFPKRPLWEKDLFLTPLGPRPF